MHRSNQALLCYGGLVVCLALLVAGTVTGLMPVGGDGCGSAFVEGDRTCSDLRADRLPLPVALLTMGAVIGLASIFGLPSQRDQEPRPPAAGGAWRWHDTTPCP